MAERRFQSVNPASEEVLATFEFCDARRVEAVLGRAEEGFRRWRESPFQERGAAFRRLAAHLRANRGELARVITAEMGKIVAEAEAEVEKCAAACEHYAAHGAELLADEPAPSSATESYVAFRPLGVVLAIMPWNFPFWQVLRFAAPALMAGNVALVKHAPSVPRSALAIEEAFRQSGFPAGTVQTLFVPESAVAGLIADRRVAAVTLTGSERAGRAVAEAAGRALKKTVLELGGSDAFLVAADADLARAAEVGVRARYQNAGQSCIAAKRFIVVEKVYAEFRDRFVAAARALRVGDPLDPGTHLGPLARADLRDHLERQLAATLAGGARLLTGGTRPPGRGYFFPPTVVEDAAPDAPVLGEEVFGPLATLVRVPDLEAAVRLANDSPYGLGYSLWTGDLDGARRLAADVEAGQVFVNGMVASDPRLPFGGVKRSGYGRELGSFGLREFVNVQTVWIGPRRE